MSNPGLSSARILWVSLPWIPITCDSSPHPDIYLVINLHSPPAHTVHSRTESSSILEDFFPLLQVSWLIKICFYHFSYCPTLGFSLTCHIALNEASSDPCRWKWAPPPLNTYIIYPWLVHLTFLPNNLVVSLSPKAQILYNETVAHWWSLIHSSSTLSQAALGLD